MIKRSIEFSSSLVVAALFHINFCRGTNKYLGAQWVDSMGDSWGSRTIDSLIGALLNY